MHLHTLQYCGAVDAHLAAVFELERRRDRLVPLYIRLSDDNADMYARYVASATDAC
jgi:hypothetical protein